MTEETYIGDGVYATFDGFDIVLRTRREHGDHWMVLEPRMLIKLIRFAEQTGVIKQRTAQ